MVVVAMVEAAWEVAGEVAEVRAKAVKGKVMAVSVGVVTATVAMVLGAAGA